MNVPRVSVVIPCYNYGAFLAEAIASVDALQYSDLELIIVDDGSTDEFTKAEVIRFQVAGYQVIRQANGGLARARNAGIKVARGEYILPLDADNRLRRPYLEQGVAILDQHPEVGVVYGDAEYFGERQGRWNIGSFDQARMLRWNCVDACALFRRKIWEQNSGYDPDMPVMGAEDWDFWLGAQQRGWKFYYLRKICYDYRVRGNSMMAQVRSGIAEINDYVARKHALQYRAELINLQRKTGSIRATFAHLLSLLVSRWKHSTLRHD